MGDNGEMEAYGGVDMEGVMWKAGWNGGRH